MDELLEKVERSLDTIRPFLKDDGGDVKVIEITKSKVVRLELLGACSSCSMSTMTMKAGIEDALKRDVPELLKVEAVNLTPLVN